MTSTFVWNELINETRVKDSGFTISLNLTFPLYSISIVINLKNANIVNTIRLAGGNSTFGRVELNMNGKWGSLCDDLVRGID